jgi:hypothetical protein
MLFSIWYTYPFGNDCVMLVCVLPYCDHVLYDAPHGILIIIE